MKLSTLLTFIAAIGGMVFIFALSVNELNTQFPSDPVNSSAWSDNYNYQDDINNTISPLKSALEKAQDPDAGYLSKIGIGLAAIPIAVTTIPSLVFTSLGYAGSIFMSFFTTFKIQTTLIVVAFVILFVWVVSKLLEQNTRWPI